MSDEYLRNLESDARKTEDLFLRSFVCATMRRTPFRPPAEAGGESTGSPTLVGEVGRGTFPLKISSLDKAAVIFDIRAVCFDCSTCAKFHGGEK